MLEKIGTMFLHEMDNDLKEMVMEGRLKRDTLKTELENNKIELYKNREEVDQLRSQAAQLQEEHFKLIENFTT
jgi:hypothetical protein